MDRDLSKAALEMKLPCKIPDESGYILNESDESLDLTDDSIDLPEYSTKQFLSVWMEEMKMFISEQLSRTTLRFQKALIGIEYEVAKNYESRRQCMYKKPESLESDSKFRRPLEDSVQGCIRRYQELQTFGIKTQVFRTDDSVMDFNQLSDLIECMSVSQYQDSVDVCSTIDMNRLHSEFKRFCVEKEKALGKLEQLNADLHASLSEVIADFKQLSEYLMRDLFIITEHEPQTIDEGRKLNRRLKSLNKLTMVYLKPLLIKMKSLRNEAERFYCQKERINQHLRDFLSTNLCAFA